jgi:hypothetical protein
LAVAVVGNRRTTWLLSALRSSWFSTVSTE